jgi:hypothetical protein
MGWTLNSLREELGQARIEEAIRDQQEWIPKGWPKIAAYVRAEWVVDPRQCLRNTYQALAFAGFKSHKDKYLLVARALGKV